MTHATHIDPHAIAARLRLLVLGLMVEMIDMLADGPLTRALRAWARVRLQRAERGAMALFVLAALRMAPYLPPALRRTHRPFAAPSGFRCRATPDPRIAQMARGFFPRERDLVARAWRLADVLSDIDRAARLVLRRMLRSHAWTQLVAIAPPAAACAALLEDASCDAADTS